MILGEPPRTAYDLHFEILGFRVRVTPFFWLMATILGFEIANAYDAFLSQPSDLDTDPVRAALHSSNPGAGALLAIWIACTFISILIHELGHSLVMRRFGIDSTIVLYHFGGLAIPTSGSAFMSAGTRMSNSQQQIMISAAGPAAQLLLAIVVLYAMFLSGHDLYWIFQISLVDLILPEINAETIRSTPLSALIHFTIYPSVFWALLNLVPIYPLDGGQISREIFTMFSRDGIRQSLMLSVVAGGILAGYGFMTQNLLLAMMFALLAFQSYQMLQAFGGRGGGLGGGPW